MNSLMNSNTSLETKQVTYHIVHETRYEYAAAVSLSQQHLHLSPGSNQFQQCNAHTIRIEPAPSETVFANDYFGNRTQYVAIAQSHDFLLITAESTVTLKPRPTLELLHASTDWTLARDDFAQITDRSKTPEALEPLNYLFESPHVQLSDELADYAMQSFTARSTVLGGSFQLMERIFHEFTFDAKATDIATPLAQLMQIKRGVCQDFAHLMIGCLRSIGLSCRYVSGYILTHPAPGKPRLIGADASHAWVSVFCPSIGWVDFDPTNRCMVNLEHITLGWGRDFSDVTLLRGVMLGSGEQELKVSVTMTPVS